MTQAWILRPGNLFSSQKAFDDFLARFPGEKQNLFLRIASSFKQEIEGRILEQNISYTGTYEKSIRIEPVTTANNEGVALILLPSGEGAARFDIYFKVLEFGAGFNPGIPHEPIRRWARRRGLTNPIRKILPRMIQGIQPHPILDVVFQLSYPDASPIGLTANGFAIADRELQRLSDNMEAQWRASSITPTTFVRRGRTVTQFRGPGGRFARG